MKMRPLWFAFTLLATVALSKPAPAQIYTPQFQIGDKYDKNEAPGKFGEVHGVVLDNKGNLYVAGQYSVQKFDHNGKFLSKFGERGTGNGQFQWGIGGIAVDKSGNIYTSDWSNYRIQKFGPDGKFLSTFGTRGTGNGQFEQPTALAVDRAGNLFVSDRDTSGGDKNCIQKFNGSGQFLTRFNTGRNWPCSLTIDAAENIYVLSVPFTGSATVFKVSPTRKPSKVLITPINVGSLGNSGYLTVDATENLYVVDGSGCHVRIFSPKGILLSQFGAPDPVGIMPAGIVVDAKSDVYLAAYGNGQAHVRKFRRRYLAP